jgi:hypothetical protein
MAIKLAPLFEKIKELGAACEAGRITEADAVKQLRRHHVMSSQDAAKLIKHWRPVVEQHENFGGADGLVLDDVGPRQWV